MYCQTCEADVAAEVSADGKSLLCTTCGSEVRKSFTPSLSDDAKSARELLERWSVDDDVDPFAKPKSADESATPESLNTPAESQRAPRPPEPPEDEIRRVDGAASLSGPKFRPRRGAPSGPRREEQSQHSRQPPEPGLPQPVQPVSSTAGADKSKKKFRIDAAHVRTVGDGAEADGPTIPPPHKRPAPAMPDGHRLDAAHGIAAPHMRTESFIPPGGKRPGRVESVAGQLLAYGGVGLLTVGTALILWGYFGGPVKYAPTGWLVATVGQMLLFLGVVTLISGGMQQTTHEVGVRVADLGSRLGRIEETTELALNAPHFMKDRRETRSRVDSYGRDSGDRRVE